MCGLRREDGEQVDDSRLGRVALDQANHSLQEHARIPAGVEGAVEDLPTVQLVATLQHSLEQGFLGLELV